MSITATPVTPEVGVEITGLTGHQFLEPGVAADCQAALDTYGVVVYREAHLDDDDLVAFSRLLGEVIVAPMGGLKDHPAISPISLDPARSELANYRKSTFFWHIDGVNDDVPQKASLLAARHVSDEGGDTEFANTYAAYDALPEDEKTYLATLRVVHSFAATQLLTNPHPSEKERAAWNRVPSREHPLIWTRRSGRKSLLVGATTDHVVGLPPEESRALLDRLAAWSTQPRFVLRHHWRPGDLVIWDNTGMLHRALPYEPTSPRLLHRTTLTGVETIA
ncbi:TauD/TfdA family dioxygenase [Frankia sp. CNm7]|uniref:TauD/TfdA family dioxygenase n=1 Tax=Frankia nepalensis TaxID=1836974 RepID=A0A937URB6_9ACTN|nr:TauD/TfdA family dioxygenase [Frankia nepalensis]MBL7496364.1 TauD/TfdA family dioxygenase [Frankia nepalensis]MBL7508439.1 TauD/TfdA family dioxygenase [Frankia nepalensis]MBL7520257.1 TauD/TfdA family dioxygenase [Frankia nepalensis]MBL7627571.1 TauD/TfdA family dioxygenase [Frankia nepalensis]